MYLHFHSMIVLLFVWHNTPNWMSLPDNDLNVRNACSHTVLFVTNPVRNQSCS
ncbi:hypothetical protein ACRALDRAFT_210096 [Sodiomyces alcalophilus JCM 7366]|uniref:uncharacterized protein n=1 Tax=Sodiomyces alcalophilus JCM 7366 TaxID=591952 RepID=UPI0039B46E2E